MTWAAICRYNQARSIIAGAALRKFFPDETTHTYGIEATSGRRIPSEVATIATNWNLEAFDRISKPVDVQTLQVSNTSILAADDFVAETLLTQNPSLNVTSLSAYADDYRLMPADPTGYSSRDLTRELAKVLILTIRWAHAQSPSTPTIYSHWVESEEKNWWRNCTQINDPSALLIDVNFTISEKKQWYGARKVLTFNPRRLDSINLEELSQPNLVLQSGFEIDNPDLIFTSTAWREFLQRTAITREIHLLSDYTETSHRETNTPLTALTHSLETTIW